MERCLKVKTICSVFKSETEEHTFTPLGSFDDKIPVDITRLNEITSIECKRGNLLESVTLCIARPGYVSIGHSLNNTSVSLSSNLILAPLPIDTLNKLIRCDER